MTVDEPSEQLSALPHGDRMRAPSDLEAIQKREDELDQLEQEQPQGAPQSEARAAGRYPSDLVVAVSGGGFRATLGALGVFRLLADADLLGRVKVCSSVSGGSIASGLLARHWHVLSDADFTREAFDEHVLKPFVDQVSRHSLQGSLYRNIWRAWGPRSFVDVFVDHLNDWFYGNMKLEELPPRGCRFIFNASDLASGKRFAFERGAIGSAFAKQDPAGRGIELAHAVAASCAVPGVFPPLRLSKEQFNQNEAPLLVDGGVYDTLALDPVDRFDRFRSGRCLVSLGAGGMYVGGSVPRPLARFFTILRAGEMAMGQVTAQRGEVLQERFLAYERVRNARSDQYPDWARRGVHFRLEGTPVSERASWLGPEGEQRKEQRPEIPPWGPAVDPDDPHQSKADWGVRLAHVPTSLKKMDAEICRSLVHRTWWLTGASLATHHPDLLPEEKYPTWVDW